MRKKFTTYIEEDSIAWIKRKALEREIKKGKKVSAADILNELIEKEKKMITYKNLQFAHAATNGRTDHSDLEFKVGGVKYLICNVPAPEGWDRESDWTDDDDYIDRVVEERVAAKEYEVSVDGEWQSAE